MTLFRNRKDGHLYLIYHDSPRQYTGSWYRAEPYFPNQGKTIKNAKLSDFDVVSGKPRESLVEKSGAGHEFWVIMVKRRDRKLYADLHKTNCTIYLSEEEAKADLAKFPGHHVVKLIACLG